MLLIVQLEAQFAQAWMIVRTTPQRPAEFPVCFFNRLFIYAGEPKFHVAIFVELPVLIAVGPEPVAAVIVVFVGITHSNAVAIMGPQLLDQAIV